MVTWYRKSRIFQMELFCPLVGRRPQLVDTYDSVHPLAGEGDMGIPSIEDVLGLDEVSEMRLVSV